MKRENAQKQVCSTMLLHYLVAALALAWLTTPVNLTAANRFWSGAGANNYWSTAANWGGSAPVTGDDLIFQANAVVDLTSLNSTNDLAAGTAFGSITFQSGSTNYLVYGNRIVVNNNSAPAISGQSGGVNTLRLDIQLNVSAAFEHTVAGGPLQIDGNINFNGFNLTNSVATSGRISLGGTISGNGDLVKTGNGTLLLDGLYNNTYAGITRVTDGTLELNDSAAANEMVPGDIVVSAGALLLLSEANQIADHATVTVQGSTFLGGNGLFSLNGWNEAIGALVLSGGGDVDTGAGTLTLGGDVTASASGTGIGSYNRAEIRGFLNLGNTTRTFNVANNLFANPDLIFSANITGSATAGITKIGVGSMLLSGANTFPGIATLSSGVVYADTPTAFGTSAAGTVLNGSVLELQSVTVNNEWLTNNSAASTLRNNGSTSSTWSSNVVLNADLEVDVYTNGTLNLSGAIRGAGGVTKTGPGTLQYSGSAGNNYSGDTVVNEGVLELAKTAGTAIVGSSLIIGDGWGGTQVDIVREMNDDQIDYSVPITILETGLLFLNGYSDSIGRLVLFGGDLRTGTGGTATLHGDVTVMRNSATNSSGYINGNVLLDANRTFYVSNDISLDVGANVGGAFGVIKSGAGSMYLQNSNYYAGLTVVQDGWLRIWQAYSLGATNSGTVVSNRATLALEGNFGVTNEALTLNGTGAESNYGALDSGGANFWVGPLTLNADSDIVPYGNTAAMHIIGPISGPGGVILWSSGTGQLHFEGSSANTYAGATRVNSGTLVLHKSVLNGAISGPGSLIVGDRTGGANADVVRLANVNQIVNTVPVIVNSSGLYDMDGYGDAIGSISGNGNVMLGSAIMNVGLDNTSTEFSGVISGAGGINKFTGTLGTLTLSGNNLYSGATVVDGGTLLVNGLQPQSAVTIGINGALGGSGTVGNIVGNGNVIPGTSAGCLTSSNMAFSATGDFYVELNGTTPCSGYDQLLVRGTNNLGNAVLHVSANFPPGDPIALGDQFVIINNDAAEAVSGTFDGLPDGTEFAVGAFRFRINYGNDVVLTAIELPGMTVASAVTAGNGNNSIDPNECNNLSLVISNASASPMTGISATLATASSQAMVTQPSSSYPDIPAHGTRTNVVPFQVSTMPTFGCGSDLNLALTVNSATHGSFSIPVVLHSGGPGPTPNRYDVSGNVAIPDPGTVESTNNISGFGGLLAKVAVSVYITHSYVSDLSLYLVAPDGTTVPLTLNNGGGGANYGSACSPDESRTTFDDAAATPITAGVAPFVGTYRPHGNLASLVGTAVNGSWRLRITDGFGGTAGTLRCWSLFLYPTTCETGSGYCNTCPGVYPGSLEAGDSIMTNRLFRSGGASTCDNPRPCPGPYGVFGNYRYDIYTFTNFGPAACVSVGVESPCPSGTLQLSAYLAAFTPDDLCANYLGDIGATPNQNNCFSVRVPAGATFVVVVNEVSAGSGCAGYNLIVSGLPCPPVSLAADPVAGSKVRVHWPSWAGGYTLDASGSLAPASWNSVTNEPVISGGRYNITNTTSSPVNRFYRLRKPE